MKIFLDTGDVAAIKKAAATGLVDGVTTNPSHIAATGRPFLQVVEDIAKIVSGPISAEVMAEEAHGMVNEAIDICKVAPNVNVKIPMNIEGLKAVPILENDHDIKTNVTMIFSATQVWYAMKASASYVSIVLSRLDAIGNESDLLPL